MPRVSDDFLAELGLQRADLAVHEWGNDPGSKIWRACLTHEVMGRMLESAEALALFLKRSSAPGAPPLVVVSDTRRRQLPAPG